METIMGYYGMPTRLSYKAAVRLLSEHGITVAEFDADSDGLSLDNITSAELAAWLGY